MRSMGVNEIREKFLSFFETKGCLRLPSFPLIPQNDASLLLINSGMAPMKKWFTGAEEPPRHRVTTCQKCIRTPDIERVGKTSRHGTYFEMLGNFSFGDYFKHEAINWAWEFLTKVMEIPAEKLWVSVYEEDDEARGIWINEAGVDPSHIVKLGKEDNFWEHGTGPCGPCSEIHYDRGEKYGCGKPTCGVGCDCDRYMEVWNLVFTQFDKDDEGKYNPLPKPNIDTGMGLERLAVVMQDVGNLFEVDTVQDIIGHISRIAGVKYKENEKSDVSLRVIADHIRSTVMMIADGVMASNEGRGYVLRRLLRRAARHGKLLGIDRAFLYEVADTVIDLSKAAYPELDEKREYIRTSIKIEEERFDATIDNGISVLEGYMKNAKQAGRDSISGAEAFKLHDTYGFPLDLTVEMAKEKDLSVDTEGFEKEMANQKATAKAARSDASSWESEESYDFELVNEPTVFTGYETLETHSHIVGIVSEKEVSGLIGCGEKGIIVALETPFYAEMGGQSGDIGKITCSKTGAEANVLYTRKTGDGIYLHEVAVTKGEFRLNDPADLTVDKKNRMAIARNHSATHLLHKALMEVLGNHVAQAGSLVTADRLRFDFSHFEAMTSVQLADTEQKVNDAILASMDIVTNVLDIEEAKKTGAVAQFGEKYGKKVRVVSMGDYSKEFCGGTHLTNTSQCGLFKIVSESGVAAGVRRIEAVTGQGVLDYIRFRDALIIQTAAALKTNQIYEIDKRAAALTDEQHEMQHKLDEFAGKMANIRTASLMTNIRHVGDTDVLTAQLDGTGVDDLKALGDAAKDKVADGVIVLAADTDDKITFIAMATPTAIEKGVHCGKIIKEITAVCGGRGGGKPDMAQGGGKDAGKIDNALAMVDDIVREMIKA